MSSSDACLLTLHVVVPAGRTEGRKQTTHKHCKQSWSTCWYLPLSYPILRNVWSADIFGEYVMKYLKWFETAAEGLRFLCPSCILRVAPRPPRMITAALALESMVGKALPTKMIQNSYQCFLIQRVRMQK